MLNAGQAIFGTILLMGGWTVETALTTGLNGWPSIAVGSVLLIEASIWRLRS